MTAQSSEGTVTGASERPATFREVFAVREFRPLFGTYLLSTAGDELARVALTVLVYQRTASPLLSAHDLRDRPPAVAARRTGALHAGRPAAPPPGADRDRHRAGAAARGDGHPGHTPAGPARPAVPGLAVRATVRVRALRAHGRRAGGRPLRRRHLADQHHAAAGAGRRLPGGRRARGCPEPLVGPAHRRRHVRRVGAVAEAGAPAPPGSAGRGRRRPAVAVAGYGRGAGPDRPLPTAAGHRLAAVGRHDVRLRLGGRRHAPRRRAGQGRDRHRRPPGRQPAGGHPRRPRAGPAGRARTGGRRW